MKKLSKRLCSIGLTALVLLGTVLSGCAQTMDYTEEIREYQAKLESLQAENEALREQLGLTETQSAAETETAETGTETESVADTQAVSENETETMAAVEGTTEPAPAESQAEPAPAEPAETAPESEEPLEVLVLGDSIWGNYRDDTGIAAKVEYYMEKLGYEVTVYNAAVGGTRATLDPDENEWAFDASRDTGLAMMLSILKGDTDVQLLQGKTAFEDMKKAIERKDELDWVIVSYGMNDFLNQVPPNDSEKPWTGFGTALRKAAGSLNSICPDAKVMLTTPAFGSYFPLGVRNMGDRALFKYAEVAQQAAEEKETYFIDVYNKLDINPYNADEYLEDGIHLNETGRDLYARSVVANMIYGEPGQVSGNAMDPEDFEE